MRRIIPLELVGYEKLDYDLYDENGEILYKNGDELTPNLLIMMNYKKIYKRDEPVKLNFEALELDELSEEREFQSVISKNATEYILKSTKKILKETFNGSTPSTSVCTAVRDTIVNEVADRLEQIDCIGQLRVFDEYTFSHTVNVSTISAAIGMTVGLSDEDINDLALGALLHDIGKMRIPKDVLNKPDKLDHDEFELMKSHTVLGYQLILKEMSLTERIAKVALEHQEKYGGEGYPDGLKGKQISLFAQITSIADVYDALVSKRVYKRPIFSHDALRIMLSEGSASFNPFILYKFVYLANFKDATNLVIKAEDQI